MIQRAEAEGWLLDLVRAARKENPRNSQMEEIATELLADNPTITAYNSSKENAKAEYRLKVKEFAEDGESERLLIAPSTTNRKQFVSILNIALSSDIGR